MKKIILFATLLFTFSACELVDVLDQDPKYMLDLESSITDPEMAELALVGTYSQLSGLEYNYLYCTVGGSFLSGAMLRQEYITSGNSVDASERFFPELNYWNTGDREFANDYQIIKNGNFLLEALGNIPESDFAPGRKATMTGEIHFLIALANFRLLTKYGEFWDMDSKYGMVLRNELPSVSGADKARATVAETYAEVMRNLEIAIAQAPEYTSSIIASKQAANALKAQVLFFQGEWAEAAEAADAAITSTNPLEGNYGDVFAKAETSKEIIFARGFGSNDVNNTSFALDNAFLTANWGPSPSYMEVIGDDPRREYVVWTRDGISYNDRTNGLGVHDNVHTVGKLYRSGDVVPFIYLRTAELYLIKAEALARSNAPIADAWVPISDLRERAGNTDLAVPATRDELMEEIFREWLIEIAFENWQDWFTVIRFDRLLEMSSTLQKQYDAALEQGEQFATTFLGTLQWKRINKIPDKERNSNKLVEQNPGY